MAGFSEMDVHIDKTRTDNFAGSINYPGNGFDCFFLPFFDDPNNFIVFYEDIGNGIQMTGVDDSAALYPG
jgi:hypothetical protein